MTILWHDEGEWWAVSDLCTMLLGSIAYWFPELNIIWNNYLEHSYWIVPSETCLFAFWTYDNFCHQQCYVSVSFGIELHGICNTWKYTKSVSLFCCLIISCPFPLFLFAKQDTVYALSIIFIIFMDFYHFNILPSVVSFPGWSNLVNLTHFSL